MEVRLLVAGWSAERPSAVGRVSSSAEVWLAEGSLAQAPVWLAEVWSAEGSPGSRHLRV